MVARIKRRRAAQRRVTSAHSAGPDDVDWLTLAGGSHEGQLEMEPSLTFSTSSTQPLIVFETTAGAFGIELYPHDSPLAISSLMDLARTGFYNGCLIHRVVPNFGLQFGCPFTRSESATATAAPVWGSGGAAAHTEFPLLRGGTARRDKGGNVPDEHIRKASNIAKTVCLASVPGVAGSRSSQIFVNFADNSYLDWFDDRVPEYAFTVIGKVVLGWHVVSAFETVETSDDRVPLMPIRIVRAVIRNDPLSMDLSLV
jgi:cyclophilin family peptidyl-prolyl cis-trans isomerase